MATGEAMVVARLLDTLDALSFIARNLHPPRLEALVATLQDRDAALREAMAGIAWPEPMREPVTHAAEATLRACQGLRAGAGSPDGLRQAYRALRQVSRALEALYPLTAILPTVDRFFLTSKGTAPGTRRGDGPAGVIHVANDTTERGGFSVYVPEDHDPARACPLIMALHGGSGHGRLFLWSWLREARGRGVILAAPTAIGDTWSLMEPQIDSANLMRVVDEIARRWHMDRTHLLLTGMSDGGTFTLLSGLDDGSPFTHLAPVAASCHPLLLAMADPRRLAGLPIYLVHGALDWMFPVSVARTAHRALAAAGADVAYREIADLSHAYPREEGSAVIDWFLADPRPAGAQPRRFGSSDPSRPNR
jgi:phospholipase/carboxylesterase